MKLISIFLLLVTLTIVAGCASTSITYHDTLPNELVNATVSALPHENIYTNNNVYLPLPGGEGTYCVIARTIDRGEPAADIAYSYSFNRITVTSDKFGTVNQTELMETGCGGASPNCAGYLGQTNDNADVDRIFTLPPSALSSRVIITNTGEKPAPSTKVNVVVKPCVEPPLPIPPAPGSIVKCSDYHRIINFYFGMANSNEHGYRVKYPMSPGMGWPYTEGGSIDTALRDQGTPLYIEHFHVGGYFTTMSNKLGSYSIPANLTVINKTADTCEVIP